MEEGLFHNPTFVQHVNEFAVAVAAHPSAHSEVTRRDPLTGEEKQVCPNYDTIPCSAHVTCQNEARGNFDFSGVPATFVCDPEGNKLFDNIPRTPQGVIDALNKAQEQIGRRPITGSQIARWERDLYRGDAKLAEGKYKDAFKSYQKVQEDEEIPEFVRARAAERLERFEEAVRAAIAEASELDPNRAKRELKKIIRQLKDNEELLAVAEEALAAFEQDE